MLGRKLTWSYWNGLIERIGYVYREKKMDWQSEANCCRGVFLGHFVKAFGEGNRIIIPQFFLWIERYPFSGILNGEFWVIVFCLLSGWLISRKKPRSLKSLFKTIINRYLRFAVPLLFVNSLIYCVGKTIGFSATECGSLMGNNWFASQYLLDLHFRDVIFSAIFLD